VSARALRVWWAAAAGYPLGELIEWGKRLEAKGRELAFKKFESIGGEDKGWLFDFQVWHQECYSNLVLLEDFVLTKSELETINELRAKALEVYKWALTVLDKGLGRPRGDPISSYAEMGELSVLGLALREYNSIQMRLTGKRGIWLLGAVPIEQYSWSAFLNDLDSCFHRVLEWLTARFGDLVEVAPNVYASSKSMPVAVECATMWREAVDAYYAWRLYHEDDYASLAAFIHENKAEFRVGSAAGHATHVEFHPFYARVEYYDTDEEVHAVLRMMIKYEYSDCRIEGHKYGEVTVISVSRPAFADFFRGVLPFTTSMDFRLRDPCKYWCAYFREALSVLEETKATPEEREYKLCGLAYEELKKKKS
jgi:hypothetical protein